MQRAGGQRSDSRRERIEPPQAGPERKRGVSIMDDANNPADRTRKGGLPPALQGLYPDYAAIRLRRRIRVQVFQ
jgi:hypothetical protein